MELRNAELRNLISSIEQLGDQLKGEVEREIEADSSF